MATIRGKGGGIFQVWRGARQPTLTGPYQGEFPHLSSLKSKRYLSVRREIVKIIVVLAFLLVSTTFISDTWAEEIETFNTTRVDLSGSETTLISRESSLLGIASTRQIKKVEGLHEVVLGDSLELANKPFHVGTIQVSRFHKDSNYMGENLGRKGEDVCMIWETEGQAPYLNESQGVGHRWLKIRNCKVLELKQSSKTTQSALTEYGNAVGVESGEFLQFSHSEQEAYVRGVMDGQVFLSELNKDPDARAFISCLNINLSAIISGAEKFIRDKRGQEFLVPWSLARLVGSTCPKETRLTHSADVRYAKATTEWQLIVREEDKTKTAQKQDAVDRAFIRGVLDGKVFYSFGNGYPKLVEYLDCLSQPRALEKILLGMRMATLFGDDLDKPRVYHVAQGESHVCKEIK